MAATLAPTLPKRPGPLSLDLALTARKWASLDQDFFPPTPPLDYHSPKADLVSALPTSVLPNTKPLVAVLGVGYVGTHLIENFSSKYDTLGYDISLKRIDEVEKQFTDNSRVKLTTNPKHLSEATHYLISVPTLLLSDKSIDSSYLRSALDTVATHARPGSTIVIESSVAVGMTRELLGPIAVAGRFFAGMSPERVDPGRIEPPAHAIPKVISGLDDVAPGSLDSIMRLYSAVFDHVVPVSRPEVAEMTKLYENCQRMICIAYANEMADACIPHGIDPFEVCSAASTKPFGYMPYMPGIGVGGHCIPVNPYYLLSNSSFPLLQAATETMWRRPGEIARRAIQSLTGGPDGKDRPGSSPRPRVLVVGVGFKRGQATLSNSPGLDLIRHLSLSGRVDVTFADTLVSQDSVPDVARLDDDEWNRETLESFDMIIVNVHQVGFDFGLLSELQGVRVETW